MKNLLLILFTLISSQLFAQKPFQECWGKLDSADKQYFQKDYEGALANYISFFESPCVLESPFIYYKLATCAYNVGKYQDAIQYYTFALNIMSFQPNDYKDKKWKLEPLPTNRFDLFEITYQITFNDSMNQYEYTKQKWIYAFPEVKSDAILNRAKSKIIVEDYIGAIADLTLYHKTIQDSNAVSNYLMGIALLQPTSIKPENKSKILKATKYFEASIRQYKSKGPYNDDYFFLREGYYYNAISYMTLNKKQLACENFSKAGENGKEEAFQSIKVYCK